MTDFSNILLNSDGSINTATYIKRGHELRGQQAHDYMQAIMAAAKSLFKRSSQPVSRVGSAVPSRLSATRNRSNRLTRQSRTTRLSGWRSKQQPQVPCTSLRLPNNLRFEQQRYQRSAELPFHRVSKDKQQQS